MEVVTAVLLTRSGSAGAEPLHTTGKLFRFVAVAGVAAPLAGGLVGAATAQIVYGQAFAKALSTGLGSDGLGLLVFTPVFLSVFNGEIVQFFSTKSGAQKIELIFYLILTAAICWMVFYVATVPLLIMIYPPVMLITFRIGSLGTKVAVMLIAIVGACATARGYGPVTMVSSDPVVQAQMFQVALAIIMLTCLPVAAEVGERNRLAARLLVREREASKLAETDALTVILNRRGFEQKAQEMVGKFEHNLTLVAIDIDRFKGINDRWGHQLGDLVLQHVASVLRISTRPGDLVGRLGGDEFLLLLRTGELKLAESICVRIQAELRSAPILVNAKTELLVSVSCGLAPVNRGDRIEDVYERADRALYDAKFAGRNAIRSAGAA
jgi:diguanylate cyclase (GGDEF)-like protein